MGFSYKFKTLRKGNSYDLRTQSKMSMHGNENTGEVETGMIEGSEENGIRFSSELVNERIKASLEPPHAQISARTEMMDRLIQSNSAKESTTASFRGFGHQYESPYSEGPRSSKFPAVAPLTTAGYSADNVLFVKWIEHRVRNSFTRASIKDFQQRLEVGDKSVKTKSYLIQHLSNRLNCSSAFLSVTKDTIQYARKQIVCFNCLSLSIMKSYCPWKTLLHQTQRRQSPSNPFTHFW